jgi:thiamine transport system permease protein
MVKCSFPKIIYLALALFAFLLIVSLIAGPCVAVLVYSHELPLKRILLDEYVIHILNFTFWQALISTVSVLIIGVPVARAFHRQPAFFGRSFLLRLFNISFILPAIVLVFGIASIHGTNGLINRALSIYDASFGAYLYGLFGVVLGHVTFSLPLATKILLHKLHSIPIEIWRLASLNNIKGYNLWKIIEWPCLRPSIAGLFLLIFMMCMTSFVIVLNLGGGPSVTTIEVAIFQALKFNFDIGQAAVLSVFQLVICTILMFLVIKYISKGGIQNSARRVIPFRPEVKHKFVRIYDFMFILFAIFIVILPLTGVISQGVNSKIYSLMYMPSFWQSMRNSFMIAICSGGLAALLSCALLIGYYQLRYNFTLNKWAERLVMTGNLSLMLPTFIFATGLFIILRPFINIYDFSFYLIIIMNALMILPFMMGALYSAVASFPKQEKYLCRSLDIEGWNFFRLIFWPRLKKSFSFALALGITMSWGDMGAIALFGTKDLITLPYLLFQKMASYRIEEAAVIALVIVVTSFLLFLIIEEFLGGDKVDKSEESWV